MTKTSDRKFQDGDLVIWNTVLSPVSNNIDEQYDYDAEVTGLFPQAGKSQGDWAYEIIYGKGSKCYVWGYQLRPRMFKYDPSQAGDLEEDI